VSRTKLQVSLILTRRVDGGYGFN